MPRKLAISRHHFYVPRGHFHLWRARLKVPAGHLLLALRTVNPTAPHFNLQSRTVVLAPRSLSRAHASLKTGRSSHESAVRSFPLAIGRFAPSGVRS